MPVYNGATTLKQVFEGLELQQDKSLVDAIYIINDNSNDNSKPIIENYRKQSSYKVIAIHRDKSAGLAEGYNEGIRSANTPYVITMHQDIVLKDELSFSKICGPMDDNDVVVSYPTILHPHEVWEQYNFWQKCLFSRFVDKKLPMLTGKFDCFRVEYLKKVGLFDSKTYRTAGEDSDLKIKINRDGRVTVASGVEAIHLQYIEKDFSFKKLIKKEAQIAEAQGVLLRKYGIYDLKGIVLSFFRQILLIGLLVPLLNIAVAIVIAAYTFLYTKLVYKEQYNNPRILVLPFVNLYLLVVSFYASLTGFINKRQVI